MFQDLRPEKSLTEADSYRAYEYTHLDTHAHMEKLDSPLETYMKIQNTHIAKFTYIHVCVYMYT